MSPLRALLKSPAGVANEANAAFWAAERMGLVVVDRYLAGGQVQWRRIVDRQRGESA